MKTNRRNFLKATGLTGLGLAGSAASFGFVVALLCAGACAFLLARTRLGFELRAFGKNTAAAAAGGISALRTTIIAMTLSGALAGLIGAGTVLGYKHYFEEGQATGVGFMGIAVALLARSRPLLIVPAALFFGTLAQGGMAANSLVPKEIVDVIQAVIILTVAASAAELRRTPARET